ncbi:MAG: hypothetical protein VYC02_08275 [SAR324 cluster bacterium]|nr:hypothetical protein [SAR324 cluster bacterium]
MKKFTLYPDFFQLAFRHGTPKRALMTVMLVVTILTLINNGDVILEGGSLNYVKVHLLIVFLSVSLHAVL